MGRNGTIRLLGNAAVKRQNSALSHEDECSPKELRAVEYLLQEAGGGE